nr:uncharacterized protein LOC109770352 [Aegilops tauschii subsp. strangulata]
MKHLPLMLEGSARAWLTQLPPGSIFCWDDLARVFVKTFEGSYKRPGGLAELQHCVQRQNKTLREFIQRWTTLHNTVENVTEHEAICAFMAGVRYRELNMKFGQTETPSLSRAVEIANLYANSEEEDRLISGKIRAANAHQSDNNKGKKHKGKAEAGGSVEAAALDNQGKSKGSQNTKKDWKGKKQVTLKSDILDEPC